MGCGDSTELHAKYTDVIAERDLLSLELAGLQKHAEELEAECLDTNKKSSEQLNLYRFKIEILAQMLAVEEKKMQAATKRLEALKLAMLNEGFSSKTMSTALQSSGEGANITKGDDKIALLTSAFDISGAIARLSAEMKEYPEDIIHAFADPEGKILSSLPREDFMRYLYNATETLSKTDVQILSFRFYDGSTVSVPEFIDFFTCSASARAAKSAASAVRASLNMLQLESDGYEGRESVEGHNESNISLQAAVRKLLIIWEEVEDEICSEFNDIEQHIGGGHVVQRDTFEDVLDVICGAKRRAEMKRTGATQRELSRWLTVDDVNLVAARFEFGDRVDVNQFLTFFQDAYGQPDAAVVAAAVAPFRFSSEWSKLRKDTRRDLNTSRTIPQSELTFEDDHGGECDDVYKDDLPLPQSHVVNKPPRMASETTNSQPQMKTQLSKSAPPGSEKLLVASEESGRPNVESVPTFYNKDKSSFAKKLEALADEYFFTPLSLNSSLRKLCREEVPDANIREFVRSIRVVDGRCSYEDVISTLDAALVAMGIDTMPSWSDQRIRIAAEKVASRSQSISLLEEEARLDDITRDYKANPKEFQARLTGGSTVAKNHTLSIDDLAAAFKRAVPTASDDHINAIMGQLEPKIRKETNDILLSALVNHLKCRLQQLAKIDKEIAAQRKALEIDKSRVTRMEERAQKILALKKDSQLDPISARYALDPKPFYAELQTRSSNGKTFPPDQLVVAIETMVSTADKSDFEAFKEECTLKKDKNNEIPVSAIVTILKNRERKATNSARQAAKEENAQTRDADAAAGIKSAGCCGGSQSQTHDPSLAPSQVPIDQNAPNLVASADSMESKHSTNEPTKTTNQTAANNKLARGNTTDTVDTLTFSDGGSVKDERISEDDISVDSNKIVARGRAPLPEGIAGSSSRSGFRKPMTRVDRPTRSNQQGEFDSDEDKESDREAHSRRRLKRGNDPLNEKRQQQISSIENYSSENSDEEPFSTLGK